MAVTPANKIVRGDDLTTVAGEIDKHFQRKATGKGLSTNDYTTDEKTKLAGIESGAQKNVKPDWNAASGSAAEILNKPTIPSTDSPTFTTKVSISSNSSNELTVQPNSPALLMGKYSGISYTYSIPVAVDSSKTNGTLALQSDIPTSTSALTNDSGFITADDIPAGVQPATAAPLMDGTAAVGSSAKYAKEDHRHPSDTSKANVNNPQFTGSLTIGGSGNQSVEINNGGEIIYTVGSTDNHVHLPENTDLDDVLATQSYVSTAISNKANKATTLAGYGITNAYTKTEVDTAITNAMKGGYTVVATLPTASANTMGKIYLVPLTDTETNNVKEEYVTWLDGSTYKWERLGTTQFDNSDYEERLTAAEITTLLNL